MMFCRVLVIHLLCNVVLITNSSNFNNVFSYKLTLCRVLTRLKIQMPHFASSTPITETYSASLQNAQMPNDVYYFHILG